ncbi:MAG: type II toxin-antitoxin system RelE/ParE family toxin [Azoarcus sp.]|jgi:putative addiction module killer protein|nr:type II toxin-antitoxin system RelE/ParE family toxin [Azoarcus sp.]
MNILIQSGLFSAWLKNLRNPVAKARIVARLIAAECGNFGQSRVLDEGVSEMKIDVGPGYRVYYMRKNDVVYLLLAGGDKSTQKKDIARAILMAREARAEAKPEKERS